MRRSNSLFQFSKKVQKRRIGCSTCWCGVGGEGHTRWYHFRIYFVAVGGLRVPPCRREPYVVRVRARELVGCRVGRTSLCLVQFIADMSLKISTSSCQMRVQWQVDWKAEAMYDILGTAKRDLEAMLALNGRSLTHVPL
jgi:hypothetical protein